MLLKKSLILYTLLLVFFINISIAKQVTFKGTVVDSDDRPIAGAKAKLCRISYTFTGYSHNFEDIIEKTSSAEGTFSFALEVADDAHNDYFSWFIVVEKEGYSLDCINWNIRNTEEEAKFTLDSPVELSGTIVDQGGQPVSGSSVSILMMKSKTRYRHSLDFIEGPEVLSTITDEKGKFTFNNLSSDFEVALLIKKEGRASVSTYIPGSPLSEHYKYTPGEDNIRVVQPEESRIEGIAVDKSSGKPLSGIPLMLRFYGKNNSKVMGQDIITTDENGQFSITGICAGTYNIFCVPPRYKSSDWLAMPVKLDIETGQIIEGMQVALTKGGLIEVLVTDSVTNKPLEGASILYKEQHSEGYYSRDTDEGGLAIIRLLPGIYEYANVGKDGYTGFNAQTLVTIEEGKTEHFDIKLIQMPKISGVVHDQNGKPVKGVKFTVLPTGYGLDIVSDEEGRFEIIRKDESWTSFLVCRYEEGNLAKVVILEDNSENLDIKLESGITLTGKVTDPKGNGIKKASVKMMLKQDMWSYITVKNDTIKTDEEGKFEVKAIPAEYLYEITASADGYGWQRKDIHADDAVNNILDAGMFILPVANLSVTGIIVDADGNPIPKAMVDLMSYYGQPDDVSTISDSNGNFILKGVCEGKIFIRVQADHNGKVVFARVLVDGVTSDIKIIAHESRHYIRQLITNKIYEQIIQDNEKVIAGIVVDGNGLPVADIPVAANYIKSEREDASNNFTWSSSTYGDLVGTSDKQGRFVIVIEEDAQYDLLFSPIKYAAMLVYDVPAGKKDLKVTLSKGGSISGKLVRMEGNKKIPIPNVQLELEQSEQAKYVYLGYDQDKETITDSQGRFKFEHIRTKIRPNDSMSKSEWEYVPRVWELIYGDEIRAFAFLDNNVIEDYEFIIESDLTNIKQLKGNPLPDFEGIKIDFDREKAKDKALLVCFFDIEQRPSRSCILELSKKTSQLKEKSIEIIAINASEIESEYLDNWLKENKIPFSVGMIETSLDETRFNWGIKALPWLILTDKEHIVTDEGFSVNELDEKNPN
ncbi:MAG: carboxypeptidase regulatory-like domain-containing protein [Sedimentisphaerales bacterium]|nr:carboxypeptidase regulatory-like domain-containing protein [Sedimentisphaerales bacterium]